MTTGTATSNSPIGAIGERVEQLDALDAAGKRIGKTVRGALAPGHVKDLLSGTWLGHALHPVLTDVVVGTWTSATLLDLVGGRSSDPAARRLIAIGMAAYWPTALTGVTDWADSEPADDGIRRVGLVHAASNASALACYAASLAARRRGRRNRGVVLGLAGAAALTAGGYLGGHLVSRQGVGVDQTVFDPAPQGDDWIAVLDATQLGSEPVATVAGETPVLVVRRADGSIAAIHDRCSHRGCSLAKGEIADGVVTCACHGSRFRLDDGALLRGPATAPQPAFDAREIDGRVEVRASAA